MPLVPHIFRQYDIRGKAYSEMDEDFVYVLAFVLARKLKAEGHAKILLAHDTRESSPLFHNILEKELLAYGIEVISLGMVPTPCLYFAVHHLKIYAGIIVTASHNDNPYNGFKIWFGYSTLYGEEIQQLYRAMAEIYAEAEQNKEDITSTLAHYSDLRIGLNKELFSYYEIRPHYTKALTGQASPLEYTIAIDGGNGTAGQLCCEILILLGAKIIPLYCEPLPDFPHHAPDPTKAENCIDLAQVILEKGADFGIGLDGDGDRLVMLDRNGRLLASDELLSFLAFNAVQKDPNATILADVKCSKNLFRYIDELGAKSVLSPTGHSLMKKYMREKSAHLGGELSGHFFHNDWYGIDDGILTALRVVDALQKYKVDLSDIPVWGKSFISPEINLVCPEDKKAFIIKKAQEYYTDKYKSSAFVSCIDGIRVEVEKAWFLIRASNTSANLTLRFEADTKEALQALQDSIIENLNSWLTSTP